MLKRSRKDKVFWTESEMNAIVQRAVDTQMERPDLAGLPLFRAAMLALPAGRRRSIVALTQVSWFESAVKAEGEKRRLTYEQASNPIIPFIKEAASEVHANREMISQHVCELAAYHGEILSLLGRTLEALGMILSEIREIGDRLDRVLSGSGDERQSGDWRG